MRAGSRIFAGTSTRTNRPGIDALSLTARQSGLEVVEVEVAGGLHLKSACTVLDSRTLVYYPGSFDVRPFELLGFEFIEAQEPEGANLLSFGSDVVVSKAAPETAALLERRGHRAHSVDVGEFHKGDGALTCLSIRRAPFGSWTT
jgi:dimethylargininase